MNNNVDSVTRGATSNLRQGNLHVAMLSLHTSPFVQPGEGDSGGMNVYIRELVSSLAHKGVQCTIYVRRWAASIPHEVMIEPGVRLVHIDAGDPGLSKNELPGIVNKFTEEVEKDLSKRPDIDVLHAHYWLSGVSGHVLKHQLEIPLVTTFHTLGRAKGSSGDSEPLNRSLKEQEIIDCSEVVVANSSVEARQLQDLYGASADRVVVVPLGVEHAFFSPGNQEAARSALGLEDGPIVLFVGRLQPLKGVDLAIETFAALNLAKATLLIVGGASGLKADIEEQGIRELVRSRGLQSQVRLVAPQPHHILSTFYRASDIVLVPSRSESFGLVALEAAACGAPVIAASVGGLKDLIVHGETGFLVDEREPMAYARYASQVLNNPLLAAEMAMSAAEKARKYSWNKTANQILRIYDSVTAKALVDCR
jgi:D-inositol-3-phosphate glycosyltransferase